MKKQEKVNKVSRGPGRPQYEIKWPRGKFTFTDLMTLNEVNTQTGKGKFCSKLTLIKGLKRDAKAKSNSLIIQLKGVLAPSNSKSGLGRKQLVYCRRSMIRTPKNDEVTVDVSQDTKDYETTKAALLAPSPDEVVIAEPVSALEVTAQVVPVITIAPAPEVAPEVTVTPPVAVADVAPLSDLVVEAPPGPRISE
jgi:hypothetical protein